MNAPDRVRVGPSASADGPGPGLILEGFAGAGGLSEGARLLGYNDSLGYETSADACATARAAGHRRVQADIRSLAPDRHGEATGSTSGPPCPTYSGGGLGTGLADYDIILRAVAPIADAPLPRAVINEVTAAVADPRTALVLETLETALSRPGLQWLVAEQVPAVHGIWELFAADMAAHHRWDHCTVLTLRADDFGAATRRTRAILIATRGHAPDLSGLPYRGRWDCGRLGPGPVLQPAHPHSPFPVTSMASALGWPKGVHVNTRGNRQTPGGNVFCADDPAPSLTGKARSWYRTDLGKEDGRLRAWEAGVLQGFPVDYPWRGSRSSQFQQIADAVPVPMAAAVIGAATRTPWQAAVRDRLTGIYGRDLEPVAVQSALWEVA